jgi:fucose permease
LPSLSIDDSEKFKFGSAFYRFLSDRNSYVFFFGIFCYVGVEQGINNWSSQFLYQYHGQDPNQVGVEVISGFWGNLTLGTLVSLILIKILDGKILLKFYALSSSVLILIALFGNLEYSILSFKLMGFSLSGIWALVISLGLNSVKKNHGTFTGILLTGIVGGAIFPFLIALISQISELRYGMILIFFGLLYISYIGFYSKPIDKNNLIKL